jgi:TetR/AcrR family transcriptional regulator
MGGSICVAPSWLAPPGQRAYHIGRSLVAGPPPVRPGALHSAGARAISRVLKLISDPAIMPSPSSGKPRARKRPSKTSPRVRRGIGRPAAGPQAVGREALIARTCELLMQLPPNRITRAEVARQMGVDPSLIRYYFRDRSLLLLAAVEKLTTEFSRIRDRELRHCGTGPEGKLRARVSALLKFEITYPFFHRLLIDEFLHLNSPAAARFMHEMTVGAISGYGAILDAGVKEGTFRRTDSAFVFLAVIGMCEFFVNGMPILRIAMGKNFDEKTVSARYREFICELLINGLKAPGAKPAAVPGIIPVSGNSYSRMG